ncbi:ATP-dependent protease ATPase subunit HslU [Gimesia panareensis]|uniref:ATP-dependent protease ATPase subunit HslU n=1 Tax=Gimesia panareensis TaxID=2527978 RepID=A0A518FTX0_9PLAN|nr:ATP-dependent protease ATPase subunit HslU [Gimesia panareensis]QDT28996.1 ATP-dependent protease ATPase subunit HslU [Gimesia panareensis]QDU51848.1 ATP-dependent protease ATPase subunit HslU [Gimesia panareensis]QDV19788.1 ATP-dependent protease ATPase subunit HslU [Gimesia panareensis]
MHELTPRQIVAELDKHIVGQDDAKRAVAIALRNRWRWQQLPDELRKEITPKNIVMIGPTGVGKTEITRRLAQLIDAPFIKVEATKYTEVGYYGRDVESMVRDLVDSAKNLVREKKRVELVDKAKARVEERLLDLLIPRPEWESSFRESTEDAKEEDSQERYERTRDKFRTMLSQGALEEKEVEISVDQKSSPVQVFSNMGMDQMDVDLQGMFERIMPQQSKHRKLTVKEARKVLLEQEVEGLMDKDAIAEEAIELAERHGIVFIDEIDKICTSEEGGNRSGDVSRQGVQRDLLPIVEGTTVQTRSGSVKTDYMLFIAAGAFHRTKPSDLMPELQGRFPIRVELQELTREDFLRILTEPTSSITMQYQALLKTEGVQVKFEQDGLEELADIAFQVNQTTQNIGARRLHTILERLLEEVSYEAPDLKTKKITIDAAYVQQKLHTIVEDEDLSKFIL